MIGAPVDRLLQITDIHFWQVVLNPFRLMNKRFLGNANVWYRRRKEFVTANAPAYSQALAQTGPKTVLITGDFTSTAMPGEFEQSARFVEGLEALGLRVIVFPGNHDVYTFEASRRKRFEKYLGQWLPALQLPAQLQLPGGTPLVVTPTCCPNILSSKGRITDIQAQATADMIAQWGPRPVLVAGHYPALHETAAYHSKAGRRLRNADALREALGAALGPVLYCCGHVHRFSLTRDGRYPHVHHLTTGAFLRRAPESNCDGDFSEIHIGTEDFAVIRHVHNNGWESHDTPFPAAPSQ